MNEDEDNLTAMQQQLIGAHEIFTTLSESGFTHSEALYLVGMMICGGPRPPVEGM